MARAVARLKGDTTMFDDLEPDAEICFRSDNENCCSDRATALDGVLVDAGPAVPVSDTSSTAEPDLAVT